MEKNMFDIEYKGGNAVTITTKKTKIVSDPELSSLGLKSIDLRNVVQVATEARFIVNSDETRITIEGPGEYEVGDFSILGIAGQRHIDTKTDKSQSTLYRIGIGDVKIILLGNVTTRLNDIQLEQIGPVDICIIPVGGGGVTLDAVGAAHVARQIDARVIIPVHYSDTNLQYEVTQDSVDMFINEMGGSHEITARYKVKSAATLPTSVTVVEVTRS